jgi:hypothetical protein
VSVELRPTTRVAFLIALEAALFRAGLVLVGWSVLYAMLGGLMGAALSRLGTGRAARSSAGRRRLSSSAWRPHASSWRSSATTRR